MSRNSVFFSVFLFLMIICAVFSFAQDREETQRNNILRNADFSDSFAHWLFVGKGKNLYHPEDPGRAEFSVKNGIVEIFITNEGNSIWSIILYQEVPLKKGVVYVVSFSAKSDAERKLIANITQNHTWKNISGDRSFQLTPQLTRYEYRFTMTDQGKALFQFCLGAIGTGRVYLTDISLYPL